jgi:deoxyribonuclease II
LVRNSTIIDFELVETSIIYRFVLYKLPRLHESPIPTVQQGLGYVFLTPNSSPGWTLGAFSINDTLSPPGRTLSPIYDSSQRSQLLRVLYNDQPPGLPVSFTHGHTKGVVLAGEGQGLWLVHSVPHFPTDPEKSEYAYPATGEHYGQTMMCITLPTGQMDAVGTRKFLSSI